MSNDWKSRLDEIVDEGSEEVVGIRRHLHAHPEPSGQELETSLTLYQLLGELGLDVRMGPQGCGVIADPTCGQAPVAGPSAATGALSRVAFRADIDGLRIQDQKRAPYRSRRDGLMHACGHDAHAAIAYGVARALSRLQQQDQLPYPVPWRAIFQPAEETATGARQMIAADALDGVGAIVALHVDPTRPTGQIGIRRGVMTAHCDSMRIVVRGQGGHAARPHESKDPIAAMAQLISTLYQFIPRATDSLDAVVITVGQIRGGETPNVIPDVAELHGTVRTLTDPVRLQTIQHIRTLATGIEQVTDTRIEVAMDVSIPSIVNHDHLTESIDQAAGEVVGRANVRPIDRPSMGSEDFACYLQHVPGAMFRLGTGPPQPSEPGLEKAGDQTLSPGLHTPHFDIDERALAIGVRILARTVVMAAKADF